MLLWLVGAIEVVRWRSLRATMITHYPVSWDTAWGACDTSRYGLIRYGPVLSIRTWFGEHLGYRGQNSRVKTDAPFLPYRSRVDAKTKLVDFWLRPAVRQSWLRKLGVQFWQPTLTNNVDNSESSQSEKVFFMSVTVTIVTQRTTTTTNIPTMMKHLMPATSTLYKTSEGWFC